MEMAFRKPTLDLCGRIPPVKSIFVYLSLALSPCLAHSGGSVAAAEIAMMVRLAAGEKADAVAAALGGGRLRLFYLHRYPDEDINLARALHGWFKPERRESVREHFAALTGNTWHLPLGQTRNTRNGKTVSLYFSRSLEREDYASLRDGITRFRVHLVSELDHPLADIRSLSRQEFSRHHGSAIRERQDLGLLGQALRARLGALSSAKGEATLFATRRNLHAPSYGDQNLFFVREPNAAFHSASAIALELDFGVSARLNPEELEHLFQTILDSARAEF